MNINKLLAPRMSNKTIILMLFAYLAMTVILVVMAAKPFEGRAALNFGGGANTVLAAAPADSGMIPAFDFMTPTVHVPAAPYIIVD